MNMDRICFLLLSSSVTLVMVRGQCFSPLGSSSELSTTASWISKFPVIVKAVLISQDTDSLAEIKIQEIYKGDKELTNLHGNESGKLQVWGWPRHCRNISRDQVIILHLSQTGNGSLVVEGLQLYSSQLERLVYQMLGWGQWSSWSSCRRWCGGGLQHRVRLCLASSLEFCQGRAREVRLCNNFSCSGSVNALSWFNVRYFKPSRRSLIKVSDWHKGWRIKTDSYFLIPYKQAFPDDWTILISFKAEYISQGAIFSLTGPDGREENLSLKIALDSSSRAKNNKEGSLFLKLIHTSRNNTRTVTIPAHIQNNTWTQLAISIEGGRTIKTFINCSWVTTQIIDGHSFLVAPQPDLVIGYMMQMELDQFTITNRPGDVSHQCDLHSHMDPHHHHHDHHHHQLEEEEESGSGVLEGSGGAPGDDEDVGSSMIGLEEEERMVEWTEWSPCSGTCTNSSQSRWSRCVDSGSETQDMMDCIKNGAEKKETRVCIQEACSKEGIGVHTGGHDAVHAGGHEVHAGVQNGGHRDNAGFHLTSKDIERVRRLQRFQGIQRTAKVLHMRYVEAKREGEPGCECHNSGVCSPVSPSSCLCPPGWGGSHCEVPLCRPDCGPAGSCVKPDVCSCLPGYAGRLCEKYTSHKAPLHCPLNCQHGGQCNLDYTKCLCKPSYYGDFCQKRSCLSYIVVREPHIKRYRRKGLSFLRTVYSTTTKERFNSF